MGLTGGLVRSVFSKSRSIGSHDSNVKNSAMEKRKWSAVRSYLCGEEFNSAVAEEDSASVRSSEATITQSTHGSSEDTVTQPVVTDKEDNQSKENNEYRRNGEKHNSTAILFLRDDAAIVIQSAFRRFLARRENEEMRLMEGVAGVPVGPGSPSRESVGTSIEVQTGNSVEVLSIHEESSVLPHRMHHRSRSQVLKLKEDWDDSTVSSNISKMRIQNRLEATTRRERALAYAFSQQLRICPRKKQARSEGTEQDIGWSWLERWMATRLPEGSAVEDCTSKELEPITIKERSVVRKKLFDGALEEKESCGSNDVSAQTDCLSTPAPEEEHLSWHGKNRLKAVRGVSRRKTVPSYHYSKENIKVMKKECAKDDEKDGKQKHKQSGNKKEMKSKDNTFDHPTETVASNDFKLVF